MTARSSQAEVRNPVLALPCMDQLAALEPSARAGLRAFLLDLKADAAGRAEKCWRTHKAPMALYWKCVSVYAGHLARAVASSAVKLDHQPSPAGDNNFRLMTPNAARRALKLPIIGDDA